MDTLKISDIWEILSLKILFPIPHHYEKTFPKVQY